MRETNANLMARDRFDYEKERDAIKDQQQEERFQMEGRRLDIQELQIKNQHESTMALQNQMAATQKDMLDFMKQMFMQQRGTNG